ncbi:TPA: hypothetical protein ACKQBZ_003526 [Stenotrophomonas maltophilia]|uniref:hypothetical protein n=1 Tax=Stenotrophomonas forensis TaxID=2871169 RepID=UPI0018D3001F|nr:hypothetical protein [Stenotrophomonas maltophilia]MBH1553000.1 hypothetical protein [Stenotrophomonas maltophilia]MBH1553004.1 hypothetical protein [Stenotrophomonas maltophilia]MBH1600954.1 hypothetical protein [Stenotrophomonas maltophilia]
MSYTCEITLYLRGAELRPEVLSGILNAKPTRAHEKGNRWVTSAGSEVVERMGLWVLSLQGEQADIPRMISSIGRLVGSAGIPMAELPGVDEAFLDILVISAANETGGGTCELSMEAETAHGLGQLGLPVQMTFTVVVQ